MKRIPITNVEYQPVGKKDDTTTKPLPKIQDIQYSNLNIQNIGPINRFKGVNTLDPLSISPDYAASMKNLTVTGGAAPSLKTRPAFTASLAETNVTGMGLHLNSLLHAVVGGKWKRNVAGVWSDLATGLSTSAKWSFTNFIGNFTSVNIIGVNGVDTPRRYDGTTFTTLGGLPSGVNFKVIDQHDNRLYASDGKSVFHSALSKGEDWTTLEDAGEILIETNTGEDVTAIKAGMKHLMVFKPNAFFELWGTGPHNHRLDLISETGAAGIDAVTVKDEIAYWIGEKGIFQYTGGLPRDDFAIPVEGYLRQINKAAIANACVLSTNESVLFSFPTGTSTVNDTTLEYSPDFETWTVWKDFSPRVWAFIDKEIYYGDANGVYKSTTSSASVPWEWVSPPINGGTHSTRHTWHKLFYVIDYPAGTSLNIYVSRYAEGDNTWDSVYTISTSANDTSGESGINRLLESRRAIIPLSNYNSNWLRVKVTGVGLAKLIEMNIQQRQLPLN